MTSQYRHRRTSSASTAFPTLEPGEISVNTANRQIAVGDAASATLGQPLELLAIRVFDTDANYVAGDYVIQAGTLYRANGTAGPGAFAPASWTMMVGQIDQQYVAVAGDQMTGALELPAAAPTLAVHATNKAYVDAQVGTKATVIVASGPPVLATTADGTIWYNTVIGQPFIKYNDGNSSQWVILVPLPDTDTFLLKAGDFMTGLLALSGPPEADNHAATKAYVDSTSGGGVVIGIRSYTSNSTYTPSPNMISCVIECVGGGGGGGGCVGFASGMYGGGGGGAGSYSRKFATRAMIGASQAITIGASGGGTSGANGGNGTATSVGSLCVANGGGGGSYSSNATMGSAGAGGPAGTGDVAGVGQPGGSGMYNGTANNIQSYPFQGGSTQFGGGGRTQSGAGLAAIGYGGGGSGGFGSTASTAGGAGSPGLVVITEYGTTTSDPNDVVASKKNYIVNGAMMISQENGATAGTANPYFAVDQFAMSYSNTGTQTAQQIANVTPGGSSHRFRVTATVADATVAASELCVIYQNIEGLRIVDLKFGLATAKTITLQFGVKAPAGTYCVIFRNNAQDRCYVAEYVIAAGEANTEVVKSITISGDTTGAWLLNSGIGLTILWSLMCGTAYQGAANTWISTSVLGSANQFNFMGTVNNIFELFDVSLTEGPFAPPFVVPDYDNELLACQRYFYKIIGPGLLGLAQAYSATLTGGAVIMLPCEMRNLPVISYSGNTHFLTSTPAGGTTASSAMTFSSVGGRTNCFQTGVCTFASTGGAAGQSSTQSIIASGWVAASARL